MVLIFCIPILLYSLYVGYCIFGWRSAGDLSRQFGTVPLSIIIPVRNEENTIAGRLRSLIADVKRINGSEIILVNDHSTDDTSRVLEKWKNEPNVHVIHLAADAGKKAALSAGVAIARNEHIVCTDADVHDPPSWLINVSRICSDPDVDMFILPVLVAGGNRFIDRLQQMDQAMLTGIAIGSAKNGQAVWGNGAALVFRRSTFDSAGGYKGNEHIASGDDVFLIHKFKAAGKKIQARSDLRLTVLADPIKNWHSLLDQRLRWGSKATAYRDPMALLVSVLGPLRWICTIVLLLSVWNAPGVYPWFSATLVMISFVLDLSLVHIVLRSNSLKLPFWAYIIVPVFYLFFGVYLIIASLFRRPEWKGRRAVRFDP